MDPLIEALPRAIESDGQGRYTLTVKSIGVVLSVGRIRFDRQEILGDLVVQCGLPGVRTRSGRVSAGTLNLSSAHAIHQWARLLEERTDAIELDWHGYLDELSEYVIAAERTGADAIDLRTVISPPLDDAHSVLGFTLPRRHPSVLFGDGGSAKSLLGLSIAGRLANGGLRVGFFDWELAPEDHRLRLGRLFGEQSMPAIMYVRAERPLVHEVDRLLRITREHRLDFAIFDSVAFATEGPPEAAESASAYYRAARRIGIGGLHMAHTTKSNGGGDRTPFGSVFWHNGARATWFIQRAGSGAGPDLNVTVQQRKSNLGPLQAPFGLRLSFDEDQIRIAWKASTSQPTPLQESTVASRIPDVLRAGPLSISAIATELDEKVDTVAKALKRDEGRAFARLKGAGRAALWANVDDTDASL